MEWYWWLVIAIAVVGALAGAAWAGYARGRADTVREYRAQLTQRATEVQRSTRRAAPDADSNPMVCPPPMVGDETVMQWALRTYAARPELLPANADPQYGIWSSIVVEMYMQASQDLGVARHFNFTDMAALQEKFTATLVLVFDKGLRRKAIDAMQKVHADFDITPAEYDRVVDMLSTILKRYRVPAEAFPAIQKIVVTLKPVIAKPVRVA